jgi:eukaryotic-like serine/threonine-protein kinase
MLGHEACIGLRDSVTDFADAGRAGAPPRGDRDGSLVHFTVGMVERRQHSRVVSARAIDGDAKDPPIDAGDRTVVDGLPAMTRDSDTSMRTKRFGKYQLLMELGRGGMATVYLAVARAGIQDVRKLVVIKLLNENLWTDPEFVQMFAREARIAAELSHPNVVLTHTVGQEDGRYYIAMEYLEGVTLRDIMRYSGEWPLQDRLPLFGAMCLALTGLGYVHDFRDHRDEHLALIHRDLKPDNIFITTTGQVKLLDFGVAKASAAGFEPTLGINVRGTVQYLPPEATKSDAIVDQRWDLFSAAVILAELATGRRYWEGLSITQIISRLAADDLPIPSRGTDEEIPPVLKRLLERGLQPDPLARYQSSLELCKAIQSFLARQAYRVNATDLQRIVGHLFEPIRLQREEMLRGALEEMDRTRPPSGTWSIAAGSASDHEVPTPPGPVREDTAPTVQDMDNSSPPPRDNRLWIAAAVLLFVSVTGVWLATRNRTDPADSHVAEKKEAKETPAPRPEPSPAQASETKAAAIAPVIPPAPTSTPPAVESRPAEPKPAAVTPEAAPESTTSPAAAEEPPAPAPASSPKSSRSRKSKSRSSSSSSRPTEAEKDADDDTPKPAPAGKKLELEPSPYTR